MDAIPLYYVWKYTDVDRAFWKEHLEDWMPEEIFDAHSHVNEPRFRIEEVTDELRRQYWVNEVGEPIGAADAARCDEIVYPGRKLSKLVFGFPMLSYDIEASNRALQEECAKRGWYRLTVTRPQWTVEQVAAELDRPGVLGVKVYYALISHDAISRDKHIEAGIFEFLPRHQLELLDQRGAWVILHVPKAGRLGHPDNISQIKQIRRDYPNIILVIAHLGRSYTLAHAAEALPQLAADDGLFFDNSAVLNPEVHRHAINVLGAERILYGTDNPIFFMRGRRQWKGRSYVNRTSYPFYFNRDREPAEIEAGYTLYMYEALLAIKRSCEELKLSRRQVEGILCKNAQRLVDRAT